MARKTGVTSNTAKRLVVDAGAIYFNYDTENERVAGATTEGATFTLEQEMREVEVDGFRGPMKGGRRVVEEHARITASMLELTGENLKKMIAGSQLADYTAGEAVDPTHTEVQRQTDIPPDSDYIQNVALVGRVQGSEEPIIIIIWDALADGGLELATEDGDEGSIEVQFTAHFDPTDPDTSPWAIRYPKDVEDSE